MKPILKVLGILTLSSIMSACQPEIGSQAWCDNMKEKPKGDWTANEALNFTKHCIISGITID